MIACRSCNHSRNNALPSTFIRWTGLKPSHPVIRHILTHESAILDRAQQSLASRPLSSCVSREEAQIWIAFHTNPIERVQPTPVEEPLTRVKNETRAFSEYFVP